MFSNCFYVATAHKAFDKKSKTFLDVESGHSEIYRLFFSWITVERTGGLEFKSRAN